MWVGVENHVAVDEKMTGAEVIFIFISRRVKNGVAEFGRRLLHLARNPTKKKTYPKFVSEDKNRVSRLEDRKKKGRGLFNAESSMIRIKGVILQVAQ